MMFRKIALPLFFIFTYLNAINLKEGLDLAIKNDIDCQTRKNDLETIKYDLELAYGLSKPTLDLTGTIETSKITQDRYTPKDFNNNTKTDEYILELRQPVYDGNDAHYEEKLQQSRLVSADYYLKESENKVALSYIEAYLNVLKEKDALNLYHESYTISQNIFNKISRKVEKGFGTKLEFEKSKSRLEESKVNITIQKINYKEAMLSLKYYIQSDFDSVELIKPEFYYDIPKSLDEAMDEALSKHPSMLVSMNNINVALYEYKRDLKSFHPSVDLVGSYTLNDSIHTDTKESNEYTIGIELAYNLYNGGKDVAKKNRSSTYINEKRILVEKNRQQISNRLALAWNSYILYEHKLREQKEFLLSKKFVLDTTLREFDLGTVDLTALLDAHVEYIDSKKNLISTSYDYLLSKYRVLEAMGNIVTKVKDDKRAEIWKSKEDLSSSDELVNEINHELKYLYNSSIKESDKILDIDNKPLKKVDLEEPILVKEEIDTLKSMDSESRFEEKSEKEQEIEVRVLDKDGISYIDNSFKDRFLSASNSKYTINLAISSSLNSAKRFINMNGIENDSFAFVFGKDRTLYKIVYGVFDSVDEANSAIVNLSSELRENFPRIEKIEMKQNLFKKYNN